MQNRETITPQESHQVDLVEESTYIRWQRNNSQLRAKSSMPLNNTLGIVIKLYSMLIFFNLQPSDDFRGPSRFHRHNP